MLCLILFLCLCLCPFPAALCEEHMTAERPGTPALYIWGGNKDEFLLSSYRSSNGDFVLLAQTNSTKGTPALSSRTTSEKRDGWVLQTSKTGDLISEKLISCEGTTYILGAVENSQGACYVIEESIEDTDSVTNTAYLVKYDASTEDMRKEPLPGHPHRVSACDRGLLLMGARLMDSSHVAAWSALLDADGQIVWSYCSPEDFSVAAFKESVLFQDNVILFMDKRTEHSIEQYLRILDQNGRFLRDVPLPSREHIQIHGIQPTDEGLLIYGYTYSDTGPSPTVFLHVDLHGNALLSKTFADMQSLLAVCPAAQGGYYFVENSDDGLHVFHLSEDGETELQQTFSHDNLITCRYIYEEPDGSLTCVGDFRVKTPDDNVLEKLFILHFPQKIKWE